MLTGAQCSLSKTLGGACVGGACITWQPCVYVRVPKLGCTARSDSACPPEQIAEERVEYEQGGMLGQKTTLMAQDGPML